MEKLVLKALSIVISFLLLWLVLAQFDWMKILKVDEVTDSTEEKLGKMVWDFLKKSETEVTDQAVIKPIDSIVNRICTANNIDRDRLKVHVLQNSQINAFALPNGYIVIFSGLITEADRQEELSGVISHEIAHIELNHVMKKLIKEIGLSAIISMTTGGGGTSTQQVAKILSSTAFDRKMEKDADLKAVEYMINADIDPEPFANFLYKLSHSDPDFIKHLEWISTHPESKKRASYILEQIQDQENDYQPVIVEDTWEKMKEILKSNN
jgi:predicted Zn-dependent protease